ncbi:MAG TPA: radical SAM protein [Planctomycetota bacterium]|nr:radical SAM protein [Planctomycetota bacterium]
MPRIAQLELILTERCNLGCSYCFESGKDAGNVMEPATARRALDFLFEQASPETDWVIVTLMGGEPLEQFPLIEDAVLYAEELGRRYRRTPHFNLTTNGTLLEEHHLRFFQAHGLRFCLSLDGLEEDHDLYRKTLGGRGTFRQVVDKLPMFKRYQPWQGARMTILPRTASHLADNVRGLHELGINQFVLGWATSVYWPRDSVVDLNRSLEQAFDWYLEQRLVHGNRRLRVGLFEKGEASAAFEDRGAQRTTAFGCGAGSGRIAVTPKGVFHGCSKLAWGAGGSDDAPLPLGSLDRGLDRVEDRLKLLDHSLGPRSKCSTCELNRSCSGGCHAANLAATGNLYEPPDDFCQLMFGIKDACDYMRIRMNEHGVRSLKFGAELPDVEFGVPEPS